MRNIANISHDDYSANMIIILNLLLIYSDETHTSKELKSLTFKLSIVIINDDLQRCKEGRNIQIPLLISE